MCRYVLKDRMGEVGLGQLWSAKDTQAGIDVVLTEEGDETALAVRDSILSERGQGPESDRRRYREERFLRELETVSLFRGGHVCRNVDYGLQQVCTHPQMESPPPHETDDSFSQLLELVDSHPPPRQKWTHAHPQMKKGPLCAFADGFTHEVDGC